MIGLIVKCYTAIIIVGFICLIMMFKFSRGDK